MDKLKPAQEPKYGEKKNILTKIALFVTLLLVLGAFVYMVLNPEKRLSDARNSQRAENVALIMEAMANYVDTSGNIPENINLTDKCTSFGDEICRTGATDCSNYTDLSYLISESFTTIPIDSQVEGEGTGYYISQDGEGNVTVCAPYAERGVTILLEQFVY